MKTINPRLGYLTLACGLAFALVTAFLVGIGGFQSAQAYAPSATYTVTNTNSSGDGSLRRAIQEANLNPGADTIVFDIPGCAPATPCTIQPLNALPQITGSVTISGPGADRLILDANHTMRGFNINVNEPVTITDLTIQNGATTGVGAGIRSLAPLTLIRVQLLHNQAEDYGGGVYSEGDLRVVESYFAHNSSLRSGGGLYADGWLELENSGFFSNTAVLDGGGAWGYDVLVTGGLFEQNTSGGEGGGLMASNTLFLTGTTFLHNTADFIGGGLSGSDAWISQAWFENNDSQDGGGLYSCCYLAIENSTFRENAATDGDGGGVYAQSVVLTATTFLSNTASDDGGGVSASFNVNAVQGSFVGNSAASGGGVYARYVATLSEVMVSHNTAVSEGGGVFASSASLTNSTFLSNTAGTAGGGLFVVLAVTVNATGQMASGITEPQAWISGGLFAGNESQYGGGLFVSGDLILTDSTLRQNYASEYGGGLMGQGYITVTNSLFENNTSDLNGGGLAAAPNIEGNGSVMIADSLFTGNSAQSAGGGIGTGSPLGALDFPLTIDATAFLNNSADVGGALYHALGEGQIVNSLFAANTAVTDASALGLYAPGPVSLIHSTLVGLPGNTVAGIRRHNGPLTIINSILTQHHIGILNVNGTVQQDYNLFYQNGTDIQGAFSGGTHNVLGDPHFVSPTDYHLSAASAALDIGTDAGVTVDFDNQARPSGAGYDIGYDEADLITGLSINYFPNPTTTTHIPTTFTALVTGGSGITYTWDFGDGSPLQSGNPIEHTYTTPGTKMVTVTAVNSSGPVSASVDVEVEAGELNIYLPVIVR
ncbi:MAG: PKD domain-containing protein [Chloroflexi bacterium]|nr:PKD domain-containing protein [Ardenticatenaceae bacterium]MBL1127836.1 PKD domain-containing protein [Chloroflexota bacterium]NOG33905.1 PKD domain-containing protein [Chloroflexota bacterium]GIK54763.1 MAG: hypothetical protein BroJett015_04260 [Chloroflexota bacterium]